MNLEDKTKKPKGGGLGEGVINIVGSLAQIAAMATIVGVRILTMPARLEYERLKQQESLERRAIEEELERIQKEERNNSIVDCYSCGESYRFGDTLTEYCSELCKEKGRYVSCDNGCGTSFFENEGHHNSDGNFCSYSCWDNYTY